MPKHDSNTRKSLFYFVTGDIVSGFLISLFSPEAEQPNKTTEQPPQTSKTEQPAKAVKPVKPVKPAQTSLERTIKNRRDMLIVDCVSKLLKQLHYENQKSDFENLKIYCAKRWLPSYNKDMMILREPLSELMKQNGRY